MGPSQMRMLQRAIPDQIAVNQLELGLHHLNWLDGAINIHYQQIATAIAKVAPDKRTPIRLYCAVGVRAQMAKFALEAQGYERVTNEGGYEALREAAAACAPQEC